ncbi:MAG: bifunctional folylpolyglutamate synthase/dihydrofolate synthase [Bacteroidales bacterium]|nr:bifunctional folylpolyglutamate synthase/dihydrofolate synthase [Bacteroidales bacterium]
MEATYSEAGYLRLVQDIFRRFPSVQRDGFTAGAYKPGLERMQAFDKELGSPSKQLKTIHIAGTNGKGSVANMLASACKACGLKAGLFTSPHIMDFRERMRIDGQPIPKEYVFDFLTTWMNWIIANELSFFEITTALAFKWFADEDTDIAVIETGLGGRLDSTNILEKPSITIITSIGLDHCQLLGDTLEQIAAEKAGIFKYAVPALVGETTPETAPVFNDKAWMFCPLTYADQIRPSLWHRHAAILKAMDLQSEVQAKNLRTVLAAIDILKHLPDFQKLNNDEAVIDGIVHTAKSMDFRGRWERLSSKPYVIADIGHNAHALQHNFAQLQKMVASGRFSSLIIVYGIMADKDLDAILPLMPENATYIFTAPDTPRALPADEILKRFTAFRAAKAAAKAAKASNNAQCEEPYTTVGPVTLSSRAYAFTAVRQAVQMAVHLSHNLSQQLNRSASAEDPAPPLIYIGGSTFVVAEAMPLFR